MEKAVINEKSPIKVKLEKGKTYHFCTCGRSENQPFCDGSHAVTSFKPLAFSVEEDQERNLCRCKQTKNAPFCDGTHRQL